MNRELLAKFRTDPDDLPNQRGIVSVHFEPHLRLADDVVCEGIDRLVSEVSDQWRAPRKRAPSAAAQRHFEACARLLLLNLLRAETRSKGLTVGINTNKEQLNAAKRYHPSFMTVTHFLAAKEQFLLSGSVFIAQMGFHFPGYSRSTRYALNEVTKEALRDCAPPLSAYEVAPDGETVRLKDRDGKLRDYTDTEQTIGMRTRLERINRVLSKADIGSTRPPLVHIDFEDDEIPDGQRLYRVFNDGTFEHGGRFYGGWWQNAKRNFRPTITIDGESTVEVDYKGLHPALLFLRNGLTVPDDPYALVPGADCDDAIRDMAKKTFLALLNAETLRTKEPRNFDPKKIGMTKAEFRKQVRGAFAMLPDAFGSGIGVKLQREDSELAEQVMLHFIDKGIPILPIHDSFIVAKRHRRELVQVMKGIFQNKYGTVAEVSVKEHTPTHYPTTG